jgi:hypothetical protein
MIYDLGFTILDLDWGAQNIFCKARLASPVYKCISRKGRKTNSLRPQNPGTKLRFHYPFHNKF